MTTRTAGTEDLRAAAKAAAARIRDWLLSPRVQLREGSHAGAVAGAHDAAGQPRYVYPEITGYFLHWLAEVREESGLDELSIGAVRGADWAARQFELGGVPRTRSYLGEDVRDWRNDAVFFFDLAMLARGLCAAAEAHLIPVPRETLQRVVGQLDAFVAADGELHAARLLRPDAVLPERWSTLGGPFELKATSRVVLAARHVELPSRLAAACDRLADRYAATAARIDLGMLHPTLYFAEGMLAARPDHASAVALLLERVLGLQRHDGSLPEAEHDSAIPRSDIIAQALRVGLLLSAGRTDHAPDAAALARLAGALLERVSADGSVCFRNDSATREPNVWCSMFAEQALRWFARHAEGKPLPAAEWLV